jgi:hypothetical protein
MHISCHGNAFTELLTSNYRGIHLGGIYKYTAEVGSGAIIYIPSFIKTGSSIQKLIGGGIHRHVDNMLISSAYFYLFKYRMYTKNHPNCIKVILRHILTFMIYFGRFLCESPQGMPTELT